jgi:hypothetical protein
VEFFKSAKNKYPEIIKILALFSNLQNPHLSTLKEHAKCLHCFGPAIVCCFVFIRRAGYYYPFAGTPSLEHKHATYT